MNSERLSADAMRARLAKRGYFFNPDASMTDALLESLQVNRERYGYPFCPCRLASGVYSEDKDLICPCDYRDQDVNEYGTCYCGLYVSQEVAMKQLPVASIPERRGQDPSPKALWRCTVCGYLSARPHPPDVCPVCGVSHDRFEPFSWGG